MLPSNKDAGMTSNLPFMDFHPSMWLGSNSCGAFRTFAGGLKTMKLVVLQTPCMELRFGLPFYVPLDLHPISHSGGLTGGMFALRTL